MGVGRSEGERAGSGWIFYRGPVLVALTYIAISVMYILVSDRLVSALVTDAAAVERIQSVKGVVFVTVTGLLIWYMVARLVRSLAMANARLAERERRVRALLDGAPVPVCVVRDGAFEYLNADAARLLGDAGLLEKTPLEARALPEFRAGVREMIARVERSDAGEWARDLRMNGRDGREFDAEIAACPFALDPHAVQVVILDVSEQKQMERAVRQAQKMEAVGRLAAGVAHEFNNSLTAIMGLASLVKVTTSPQAQYLAQIEEVAEQAAELTRSLLTMSRNGTSHKQRVALRGVLEDAARVIEAAMPEGVRFASSLEGLADSPVFADVGQLRQALLNLALNARDAMPKGGTLSLRAWTRATRDGREEAVVEVRDTGMGIPAEVREQLFTPFFTTKENGKGTGLGLAVTRGIVEDHGGRIEVESEVGKGSVFRVILSVERERVAT
ncbi:two-component system, NtrC family, sensor histidine kinase AtoS [Phycisphaerales bacterium]|nr:two-component system, NtrC family, sensor histidine kinase AtoS [Phycisphaerales bacterium]